MMFQMILGSLLEIPSLWLSPDGSQNGLRITSFSWIRETLTPLLIMLSEKKLITDLESQKTPLNKRFGTRLDPQLSILTKISLLLINVINQLEDLIPLSTVSTILTCALRSFQDITI